jgi:TIR domain
MSSLAELPELVGFFSYSRRDDERAGGSLSALRKRIHDELGLQLGRDVRVWQDSAAIPHGTLWEDEIARAIAESVFFIPIVTPSAVGSDHCAFEFKAFLARESALHRGDLVFPILYVRVPALTSADKRAQNELLEIIRARQYSDWTTLRQEDLSSPIVRKQVEAFCRDIVEALRKRWESPDERRRKEEAQGRRRAEEELQRQERLRQAQRAENNRRDQRPPASDPKAPPTPSEFLSRVSKSTQFIIFKWFTWLVLPISGPIKEWTEIQWRRAKGEQIGPLSAMARLSGSLFVGVAGFLAAVFLAAIVIGVLVGLLQVLQPQPRTHH